MATRRRRRRGHPRGKALGFNNMRPAAKSSSSSSTNGGGTQGTNTQGTTAPPSAPSA